jgi:hypothetical protein
MDTRNSTLINCTLLRAKREQYTSYPHVFQNGINIANFNLEGMLHPNSLAHFEAISTCIYKPRLLRTNLTSISSIDRTFWGKEMLNSMRCWALLRPKSQDLRRDAWNFRKDHGNSKTNWPLKRSMFSCFENWKLKSYAFLPLLFNCIHDTCCRRPI